MTDQMPMNNTIPQNQRERKETKEQQEQAAISWDDCCTTLRFSTPNGNVEMGHLDCDYELWEQVILVFDNLLLFFDDDNKDHFSDSIFGGSVAQELFRMNYCPDSQVLTIFAQSMALTSSTHIDLSSQDAFDEFNLAIKKMKKSFYDFRQDKIEQREYRNEPEKSYKDLVAEMEENEELSSSL
jgi:hypothetical protein